MTLSYSKRSWVDLMKSFFVWTFVLTVCYLVLGFPVVALITISGAFLMLLLQVVISSSAVLVVAGSLVSMTAIAIMTLAVLFTAWGLYPHQFQLFDFRKPQAKLKQQTIFASCPFTCALC